MRTNYKLVQTIAALWIGLIGTSSICDASENAFEPAFGYGSSSLSMSVRSPRDETIDYTTTNTSFSFVNLAYKKLAFQIKFPSKDTPETRAAKGDSKVTDYQFAYAFNNQWQIEFYYQRYKGYYIKSPTGHLIQPDLSLSHTGGQVVYVANPNYDPAMVRETSWEQKRDAGSFVIYAGYGHFDINGDLVPKELGTSMRSSLESAEINSLIIRSTYGYNWLWTNWFAGAAGGLGESVSFIKYRYRDSQNESFNNGLVPNVGLSGGYRWDRSKIAVFSRLLGWNLAFDDKQLTSTTTSTGFYFSSVF